MLSSLIPDYDPRARERFHLENNIQRIPRSTFVYEIPLHGAVGSTRSPAEEPQQKATEDYLVRMYNCMPMSKHAGHGVIGGAVFSYPAASFSVGFSSK